MNNFKILDKLGEGAYSTVFRVLRYSDNEEYALKKVKMKSLSEKEKLNALNEVRLLASVKSNYIISYKESFIDEIDSTLCIVMEYADDGDLLQKIKDYKKKRIYFKEQQIWKVFLNIVQGLHDLHQLNILHRDLKSANVFLFSDGTAKLGDLNVSKIAPRGLSCTQTGTPIYASPEVWKDNPYDLKSDMWSLGCVSYEMIMLKTPFVAKTMELLFKKIMKGKYQPVSCRYSNDLKYVISLLLEVNPLYRPDTNKILDLPEVKDKIEKYQIFKNYNFLSKKEASSSRLENSQSNLNQSKELNQSNHDECSFLRRNLEGELNVIYENENEENGVLDTIHVPSRLVLLNNKLPISNYRKDKLEELELQKIRKMQHLSFPNNNLQGINVRANIHDNKSDKNREEDILYKREKLFKNAWSNDNLILEQKLEKINTIKYNIQKKNQMISSKKMDFYVEHEGRNRYVSKSINKMKDLKYIYKPYIPQKFRRNLESNPSEKSIFGNLNYSFNCSTRSENDKDSSSNFEYKKYYPIVKIRNKNTGQD